MSIEKMETAVKTLLGRVGGDRRGFMRIDRSDWSHSSATLHNGDTWEYVDMKRVLT